MSRHRTQAPSCTINLISPTCHVNAIIPIMFTFRLGRSCYTNALHFMLAARTNSDGFRSERCDEFRHFPIEQMQQYSFNAYSQPFGITAQKTIIPLCNANHTL